MTKRRAVALAGLVLLAGAAYLGVLAWPKDAAATSPCAGPLRISEDTPPEGARPVAIPVRAGETFSVPVPDDARTGLRYELRGEDVRFAHAEPGGRPSPLHDAPWTRTLGTCQEWPADARPASLHSYVAEGDGTVTAWLTPIR